MEAIFQALKDFSPAIAIWVAIVVSIVFPVKLLVEKSISAQFAKLDRKENRKSNIREKVDIDCYERLSSWQEQIVKASTRLRGVLKGHLIGGFTDSGEIVKLREIADEIVARFHRLPSDLAEILKKEIIVLHELLDKGEAFAESGGWENFRKLLEEFERGMKQYLQKLTS